MENYIGLKRVEMTFKGVKPPRSVHTLKPTHKLVHFFYISHISSDCIKYGTNISHKVTF